MLHIFVYTGIALVALVWLGNELCRGIFNLTGLKDSIAHLPTPVHSAGRWIGALERLILAVGIIAHSWEILAAVIALKTVARFKDMDERAFAEYFLVGSLFSIFWTMLVTGAWLAYDHKVGGDVRKHAEQYMGIEAEKD
ncbi:hypothetical protein [Sphingomonas parapaucimobilis]|uniref:Uncharacterized protein n=1 Tax=Sphingomonas parapaucimobilis NBRC 15100 TaxID=1219049 RepID=A0A0A1W691_9SPHN|nr:hypothetical protein [Sphingomonas parapaucimobilis]GAM00828.1 hypothetical protein SP5_037_00210 [Sphingomonas parapaucimobilis NBRC 15100]